MIFFLLVFHVLVTFIMVCMILLQRGEDTSTSASGSTGMFSARGSKNFLTRATAILAAIFFINCLGLAILVRQEAQLPAFVTPIDKPISKPDKPSHP